MEYRLTDHAEREIVRRGLTRAQVASVLDKPEQSLAGIGGRQIHQSRVNFGGRMYLVRVVIDPTANPPAVMTAYRTSKIDKYWRKP